jgi:hypothetical protein
MSNFKLAYGTIQKIATATANLTASTTRVLANLFSGSRQDRFELAATSNDALIINYDLGASTTKTANFLAIIRAKLLHRSDCTGVRLRASAQSALSLAATPTAWFTGNREVTTSSGKVTTWADVQSTNDATQGTDANRPILSRADNSENRIIYSEDVSQANWGTVNITKSGQGFVETTASGNHALSQSITLVAGVTYEYEVEALSVGGRNVSLGSATEGSVRVNLTSGALITTTGVFSSTLIEDAGDGYRKIRGEFTASTTSNYMYIYSMDGTNTSFTGDVTKGLSLRKMAIKITAADSTYIQTTANQVRMGINGNKSPYFDGSNDSLSTSLAVNPTSGMWGIAVIKVNSLAAVCAIMSARNVSASDRLNVWIPTNGSIECNINNGNTNQIGRTAPAGTVTVNTTMVISWTYDGGTSASGIKIYKNGVQVDNNNNNAGAYTVPTGGNNLSIGQSNTGNYFNGYIPEVIFAQGSTISDANREAIEAYLTSRYITTPLVQVDNLDTQELMGANQEDYFVEFTESSAFKHFWLELVNEGTATKYNTSKIFFGKALDFGREPTLPISIKSTRRNAWSRETQHSVNINLVGVSDTNKETEIAKESDVMPMVALDTGELIFHDYKGMHCKLLNHEVTPSALIQNDISLDLEEEI